MGLHQGETAQMAGGVAVKRVALEDGRDAFKVGAPSRWVHGAAEFDGPMHRTPEDATRAAMRASGESNDPESLGGSTRVSRWPTMMHGGKECRVADWTLDGNAIVHPPGEPGNTKVVDPKGLSRKPMPGLMEAVAHREPSGKFRKGVGKLAPGESTHLPDGKRVRRLPGSSRKAYEIVDPDHDGDDDAGELPDPHAPAAKKAASAAALGEAELTAAKRSKLPSTAFALPGRRYPIHDEAHAQNALIRVAQHGSTEEKAAVKAAVKRRYPTLGKEQVAETALWLGLG